MKFSETEEFKQWNCNNISTDGAKKLIVAVIEQAIGDFYQKLPLLKEQGELSDDEFYEVVDKHFHDEERVKLSKRKAKSFLLSPACKWYCSLIQIDHEWAY